MLYHSTRGLEEPKSFYEVLHSGLAGDGGLFVPKFIPKLNMETINEWRHLSYEELSFVIISLFSFEVYSQSEEKDMTKNFVF